MIGYFPCLQWLDSLLPWREKSSNGNNVPKHHQKKEIKSPSFPHFRLRQRKICTSSLSEGSWLWVTNLVCKEVWGTGRVQKRAKDCHGTVIPWLSQMNQELPWWRKISGSLGRPGNSCGIAQGSARLERVCSFPNTQKTESPNTGTCQWGKKKKLIEELYFKRGHKNTGIENKHFLCPVG